MALLRQHYAKKKLAMHTPGQGADLDRVIHHKGGLDQVGFAEVLKAYVHHGPDGLALLHVSGTQQLSTRVPQAIHLCESILNRMVVGQTAGFCNQNVLLVGKFNLVMLPFQNREKKILIVKIDSPF